jgi:hypothetical protein
MPASQRWWCGASVAGDRNRRASARAAVATSGCRPRRTRAGPRRRAGRCSVSRSPAAAEMPTLAGSAVLAELGEQLRAAPAPRAARKTIAAGRSQQGLAAARRSPGVPRWTSARACSKLRPRAREPSSHPVNAAAAASASTSGASRRHPARSFTRRHPTPRWAPSRGVMARLARPVPKAIRRMTTRSGMVRGSGAGWSWPIRAEDGRIVGPRQSREGPRILPPTRPGSRQAPRSPAVVARGRDHHGRRSRAGGFARTPSAGGGAWPWLTAVAGFGALHERAHLVAAGGDPWRPISIT